MSEGRDCKAAERLISASVDGELAAANADVLRQHLMHCMSCAALQEDLRTLRAVAASLPDHEPPEDLFERSFNSFQKAGPPRWRRAAQLGGGLLALAAAALLAFGWWAPAKVEAPPQPTVRRPRRQADAELLRSASLEFRRAEQHYQLALSQLRLIATRESQRWEPARRRGYELRLAGLRAVIHRCRHAARISPADPALQELLFAAYRKQIHYLRRAILGGIAQDDGFAAVDVTPVDVTPGASGESL